MTQKGGGKEKRVCASARCDGAGGRGGDRKYDAKRVRNLKRGKKKKEAYKTHDRATRGLLGLQKNTPENGEGLSLALPSPAPPTKKKRLRPGGFLAQDQMKWQKKKRKTRVDGSLVKRKTIHEGTGGKVLK